MTAARPPRRRPPRRGEIMKRWTWLLPLALLIAAPAHAVIEMVVIDARGIKLNQGDVVDGSAKLTLGEGQQITLMGQDGKTLKLKGPYDQVPLSGEKAATVNVKLALASLVTQESQRERAGVIRGTGGTVTPPEPWLI